MEIIAHKEKIIKANALLIDLPMYYVKVYVFTPKMNKELTEKHGWDECEDAQARDYIKSHRNVMVRFKNETPGIVAHEMLHVVQFVMEAIGHNLDESGDEPSAYLLGYLVDEYYRLKKDLKKKKHGK
jgi:hypothetical protein